MYKIGTFVLYNYSVSKINDIIEIKDKKYYVLAPMIDQTLTIKVPVSSGNLKPLLSKKEIKILIKNIPKIEIIDLPKHTLEDEYKKLLNSGNREDLIKIIKTTYLRNKKRRDSGKKIGEKDEEFFELAEKCLYSEIAIVLKKRIEDTKKTIIKLIEKS